MHRLLENPPLLDAAFNVTLCVTSMNFSARNIEDPMQVVVGSKTVQADGMIMIPDRQLHVDENIFGPDTKSFNADRFLKNKDPSRGPSFKPFGGGSTYCSGRLIAEREVLAYISLVVHLYDLHPGNTEKAFSGMDETKATLEIMGPMKVEEVMLENQWVYEGRIGSRYLPSLDPSRPIPLVRGCGLAIAC